MIKGWCRGGAVLVQVGAVVVFIIIYLYISIFSSKIDFSLCEYLT